MRQTVAETNCALFQTKYSGQMGGVIEAGQALLSQAASRLEINALNISNVTTPGYKARVPQALRGIDFASMLQGNAAVISSDDLSAGQTRQTGNPLDLAVMGDAFFTLRTPHGLVYSRNGEFRRDGEGRVVNAAGFSLQGLDGDIVLKGDRPNILKDGTILESGEPVARIALAVPNAPSAMRRVGNDFAADAEAMHPAESATVAQAMVETSNVSMSHEVLSLMQSQKSAETGQVLVRLYDDLMARALTAFGQSGS